MIFPSHHGGHLQNLKEVAMWRFEFLSSLWKDFPGIFSYPQHYGRWLFLDALEWTTCRLSPMNAGADCCSLPVQCSTLRCLVSVRGVWVQELQHKELWYPSSRVVQVPPQGAEASLSREHIQEQTASKKIKRIISKVKNELTSFHE